jgi:pre-mRNA-splicing helicase BRR2
MEKLAAVCNRYPIVEIKCNTEKAAGKDPIGTYSMGERVELLVTIMREDEADEESFDAFKSPAFAQYFPQRKFEEWWVVVGNTRTGKLLAIKKVTNFREQMQTQA